MVLINHAVQRQCGRLHGLANILGRSRGADLKTICTWAIKKGEPDERVNQKVELSMYLKVFS